MKGLTDRPKGTLVKRELPDLPVATAVVDRVVIFPMRSQSQVTLGPTVRAILFVEASLEPYVDFLAPKACFSSDELFDETVLLNTPWG